LLEQAWIAQFLISGFSLKFNDLHGYDRFVTGMIRRCLNAGAAVDVQGRMDAGFADE
jgi:hypothetical protein